MPISKYMDHIIQAYLRAHNISTIFLMTDGGTVLDEATIAFPKIAWHYIPRVRFNGTEGGFENQVPSGDPLLEVTIILTEFKVAAQCELLIHGSSSFAATIHREMCAASWPERWACPPRFDVSPSRNSSIFTTKPYPYP